MANIIIDDDGNSITATPADMNRLKLEQRLHPNGDVRSFWSRQDISETKDIRSGCRANRSLGWYDFAKDRKAQRAAQRELNVRRIAQKDWATDSDAKVKKTEQAVLDLSKSEIAIRRRGENNLKGKTNSTSNDLKEPP